MEQGAQIGDNVHQSLLSFRPTVRPAAEETALTDLPSGLAAPGLNALSTAMVRLASDYGRSPASVTSWRLGEDCVVTALEDFLTLGEQELVERGDAELVRRLRSAFAAATGDQYLGAAERALGRKVIAHRSELICASRICVEIFVLADERGRPGASSLDLDVRHPQHSPG